MRTRQWAWVMVATSFASVTLPAAEPGIKPAIHGLVSMGAFKFVGSGGDPVNTLEPLNAKPGITGLAQIRGFRGEVRDIHHMEERIACDLEYIETWSLGMDARILFLTAVSAPFHRTAY